ncbi:hypothetical protein LguiB_004598 [Lonicera macranthoides]
MVTSCEETAALGLKESGVYVKNLYECGTKYMLFPINLTFSGVFVRNKRHAYNYPSMTN